PARDHAAAALYRDGLRAAVLPRADGHTAWADTDGGVPIIAPATVPVVVTVPPDLNIDALGHLKVLSIGRNDTNDRWSTHEHWRSDCEGQGDLRHVGVLPCLEFDLVLPGHRIGRNMEG